MRLFEQAVKRYLNAFRLLRYDRHEGKSSSNAGLWPASRLEQSVGREADDTAARLRQAGGPPLLNAGCGQDVGCSELVLRHYLGYLLVLVGGD